MSQIEKLERNIHDLKLEVNKMQAAKQQANLKVSFFL